MKKALLARLDRFRDNRSSGAVDLALEALEIADDWIASGLAVAELASELESMHPAIATVRNVGRAIREIEGAGDSAERIAALRNSLRDGNRIIGEKICGLVPAQSVVITLSNSSTVRDALLAVGPRGVYVMESNPGGEGASMADALRSGLRGAAQHEFVELIPDDSIGRYVQLSDCALVGIDTFDATGAIWHKVGTFPLAELCRRHGKPFFAAGHSLKRSPTKLSEKAPRDSKSGLELFDRTPGALITRLITEAD